MQRSKVKWFDAKKGYGFIDHPEEGDDVFVHYSQIISEKDFKTLRTGQEVTFELNDGPKGLHALDVKPLSEPAENEPAENEPAENEPAEAPSSEPPPTERESVGAGAPAASEASSERWEDEGANDWSAGSDSASSDDEDNDEDEDDPFGDSGEAPDPLAGPSF